MLTFLFQTVKYSKPLVFMTIYDAALPIYCFFPPIWCITQRYHQPSTQFHQINPPRVWTILISSHLVKRQMCYGNCDNAEYCGLLGDNWVITLLLGMTHYQTAVLPDQPILVYYHTCLAIQPLCMCQTKHHHRNTQTTWLYLHVYFMNCIYQGFTAIS